MEDYSHLLFKETLDIPAWEWLENNVYFSSDVSPNSPGNLDLSRQPWAKDILEATQDPRNTNIDLVFGAQTGKTTILMLTWLLKARFEPQPAIIALSTDPLADRLVKRRLIPLLKANPWWGDQLPAENRGQESMILFPGQPTFFTRSAHRRQARINAGIIAIVRRGFQMAERFGKGSASSTPC